MPLHALDGDHLLGASWAVSYKINPTAHVVEIYGLLPSFGACTKLVHPREEVGWREERKIAPPQKIVLVVAFFFPARTPQPDAVSVPLMLDVTNDEHAERGSGGAEQSASLGLKSVAWRPRLQKRSMLCTLSVCLL